MLTFTCYQECNTEADAQANLALHLKSKSLWIFALVPSTPSLFIYAIANLTSNCLYQVAKFKWNAT